MTKPAKPWGEEPNGGAHVLCRVCQKSIDRKMLIYHAYKHHRPQWENWIMGRTGFGMAVFEHFTIRHSEDNRPE